MYGHSWFGNLDWAPQTDGGNPRRPVFAATSPTPMTRHVTRRRVIAQRCCGHIMCGRLAPGAPRKAAWLAAVSAALHVLSV
jgi:hypothetical protein